MSIQTSHIFSSPQPCVISGHHIRQHRYRDLGGLVAEGRADSTSGIFSCWENLFLRDHGVASVSCSCFRVVLLFLKCFFFCIIFSFREALRSLQSSNFKKFQIWGLNANFKRLRVVSENLVCEGKTRRKTSTVFGVYIWRNVNYQEMGVSRIWRTLGKSLILWLLRPCKNWSFQGQLKLG